VSPNAKAKLQIDSTTQGFLPPRMTTTERDAITSVPAGLVVYNTTTNNLNSYSGSTWVELVDSNDLGTGIPTFLETPTSANLAAAVTGETGSGALVFGTSPSLTSPTIDTSATFNATTYTYGTGAADAHRTALNLAPSTIFANAISTRPVCSFFDDFLGTVNGGNPGANGAYSWSVSGNSGAASVADAMPLAYGVIQLTTGATTNSSKSILLSTGGNAVVGAKNRFCFAIPDVSNCSVYFGGGSNWQLYASSATNSGQWVIRTNASTITTFTTDAPQAGNFSSGKRYQVEICLVSTTLIALKLEIANYNSSTWTTIYDGNITVPAVNNEWGGASAIAAIATLTNAAKTLRLDWAAQEHLGISR
jgi:hypothetical protein